MKKNPPWNVLILPAAAPAGLEINRVLGVGKEAVIHGADCGGFDRAGFYYRNLLPMPELIDAACLPWLLRVCGAQKIDAIFPADLASALWLTERRAQIPAVILAPEAEAVAACATPAAMSDALKNIVPVAAAVGRTPAINGTVDCFSAADGSLLYAAARRVAADGVTQALDWPEARDWAARIGAQLGMRGVWHFRAQETDGAWQLRGVAPVLAGDAAAARGPNFPLLALYDAAGYALTVEDFAADMPMALCIRPRFHYDRPIAALYMDLDETLILRGEVNPQLAALIFQCRNRGIPVHLITRHPGDLAATLARYRLTSLFARIIHVVDRAKSKALFIEEKDAVLVDDSYQERRIAVQLRGIRCFDAAGALCLLDERL